MRKLLPLLLCMVSVCLQAETYSIHFRSGNADSSSKSANIIDILDEGTDRIVAGGVLTNIYRAKPGYGIKGGTTSNKGELTIQLNASYAISSMTIYTAAYAHKTDSASGKSLNVCGKVINWDTGHRGEIRPYTIQLTGSRQTITIAAATASYNRFYIDHIEFEAPDPLPNEAKVKMPLRKDFGSYYVGPDEPAEDDDVLTIITRSVTDSVRLSLKSGRQFEITPSVLPAQGGEVYVAFRSSAVTPHPVDYTDTLFVHAPGASGTRVFTTALLAHTSSTEPKPMETDSSCMLISVAPGSYYDAVEGLCGAQLKSTLGAIINCGVRYKYGSGTYHTWHGFYTTDRDTLTNQVLDMYSLNLRYFNPEKPKASVAEFDIEHMLPKSWWGGTVNKAYCDLFHLVPGDYSANRSKSNHAPGMVIDTTFWNGSFATGSDASGRKVFCPADEYKGDFARAYFYIATCYGDSLNWDMTTDAAGAMTNASWQEFEPWLRDLLLDWHREDPVSDKEKQRAIAVNRIQGNRNPFIDYPELAEYIWGEHQNEACHLSELTPTFSDGTPTRLILHTRSAAARKALEQGHLIIYVNQQRYDAIGRRR